MSDPQPPLTETVARIDELCAQLGKTREEVLNLPHLSYMTGLSESEIRTLLSGDSLPEPDPDAMVRQRVRFLYETRRGDKTESQQIHEIAAAIKQTPVWVRKLVAGDSKPNIHVGADLARFYRVPSSFLTDPPADALSRELQPEVLRLEIEADPGKTLADLGVRGITGRSAHLSEKGNLVELAQWVVELTAELGAATTELQRKVKTEEGR
ncbi:hypothetical protein ABT033_31470 [Streptomyces pharetrae]|uniref:hypothetical protein n=1 Tax=Streptomyces pharetrae TaxID=291370 RepID=UPI00334FF2DE